MVSLPAAAAMRAASRTASALLRGQDHAGLAQRRLLPRQILRIGRGAADEADHRQPAPGRRGLGDGGGDRRGDLAGRIGVRAVAEHDVEQDHRGLRIARLRGEAFVRSRVVDHRMRPAAREHVVAEIDQRVPLAAPDIRRAACAPPTGVLECTSGSASASSSVAS